MNIKHLIKVIFIIFNSFLIIHHENEKNIDKLTIPDNVI